MRTELQLLSYPINDEDLTDAKLVLELLGSYCYRIEVTETPEKDSRQEVNNDSTNIRHQVPVFFVSSLFAMCQVLKLQKGKYKLSVHLPQYITVFFLSHLHGI